MAPAHSLGSRRHSSSTTQKSELHFQSHQAERRRRSRLALSLAEREDTAGILVFAHANSHVECAARPSFRSPVPTVYRCTHNPCRSQKASADSDGNSPLLARHARRREGLMTGGGRRESYGPTFPARRNLTGGVVDPNLPFPACAAMRQSFAVRRRLVERCRGARASL